MDITGLVRVVMEEIKSTVRSDTIIGSPVQSGDSTVIPVSKVSFGFGAGGSERDAAKQRSGMGVGVKIEPVAFMVLTKGKARILPVKSDEAKFPRLTGIISPVLKTIQGLMNRKKRKGVAEKFDKGAAKFKK